MKQPQLTQPTTSVSSVQRRPLRLRRGEIHVQREGDALRLICLGGVLPVAALVVVTATAAGAVTPKKVTCTRQLQTVSTATNENYGKVDCGRPFGKGVQHTPRITVTPTSPNTATGRGSFKRYFDAGTIRGTAKITSTADATGAVTYAGTAKLTGGTGAYKKVRGSATFACKSQDRGLHATCTEKLTLTRI
jgi:hypothetical protein